MTFDFRSFIDNKPNILRANPEAIDLTETNIVAALNHLRPNPPPDLFPEKAHRCHLAEFWLDAFDLPRTFKPQALISQGVRSSLGLLFAIYAGMRLHLKVPSDVYPVYLEIAAAAGLDVTTYFASETITAETLGNADVILLTNPLKPWGRWLSANELDVLKTWLSRDDRRRVIVDAVYTWESQLNAMTMALFETGQAIILHSLSKGWLRPWVLGVALVPEQDVEQLAPKFRAAPTSQENLKLAQVLLTRHVDFPPSVPAVLAAAESRLRHLLAAKGVPIFNDGVDLVRYHFVINRPWEVLLAECGILALPAAVFGHPANDLCIVTSLAPRLR